MGRLWNDVLYVYQDKPKIPHDTIMSRERKWVSVPAIVNEKVAALTRHGRQMIFVGGHDVLTQWGLRATRPYSTKVV